MRRVLVLGSCGSGKSTLARVMGERLGLPVVHLDAEYWKPGWMETPREQWRARVAEIVSADRWIVDGNYGQSLDIRLPRADTVVFLDFPRRTCLRRIFVRAFRHLGRRRPDMAPGCPEKLPDLEFLAWTWNYPTRSRPKVLAALAENATRVNVIHLCTPAAVQGFVESLP